jgi:hypothetical protein
MQPFGHVGKCLVGYFAATTDIALNAVRTATMQI